MPIFAQMMLTAHNNKLLSKVIFFDVIFMQDESSEAFLCRSKRGPDFRLTTQFRVSLKKYAQNVVKFERNKLHGA